MKYLINGVLTFQDLSRLNLQNPRGVPTTPMSLNFAQIFGNNKDKIR